MIYEGDVGVTVFLEKKKTSGFVMSFLLVLSHLNGHQPFLGKLF